MSKPLKIVIIGAGNVATHISHSFQSKTQIKIVQIFNHRKTKEASALAKKNNCEFISEYKNINQDADIYMICVKDDVIVDVVKQLKKLNLKGLIVHTSGSTEMQILKNVSPQIGVYYPLETFYPSARINWKNTPLLIEANNKQALSTLRQLANFASNRVEKMNSENRLRMHLSAVFACNFTNALYVAAFDIIEKSIDKKQVKLLLPIMQSSFDKLHHTHPKESQTGPAFRNDKTVMKKHLKLLESNKELSKLYQDISDLIIKQKNS